LKLTTFTFPILQIRILNPKTPTSVKTKMMLQFFNGVVLITS